MTEIEKIDDVADGSYEQDDYEDDNWGGAGLDDDKSKNTDNKSIKPETSVTPFELKN